MLAAIHGGGSVKHQVTKVDNETKTLGYTVLPEEDTMYSSFVSEMKFTATGDNTTEVTWTAKYEPVGEAGPPEEAKQMVIITMKAFERAVTEKRVVRHNRTLEAPCDTIWNILMHEDVILPKIIPHIIASYEFLEGNGEPGSIRLLKLGHGMHIANLTLNCHRRKNIKIKESCLNSSKFFFKIYKLGIVSYLEFKKLDHAAACLFNIEKHIHDGMEIYDRIERGLN